VAALGMGVGFGLPEMLANFISGLIILFERSIRVGDTDGLVTKVRIRATTAVDSVRSTRSPLSRGIEQSSDHGKNHGARPP
jgi:small-conductance mechanosensitive channel